MTLSDFSPNVHGIFHLLKVAVWTFFSYWTYIGDLILIFKVYCGKKDLPLRPWSLQPILLW